MTSTNTDIARTHLEAVQTGNMAIVGELLAGDIVWHQPGANQFSGDHEGQEAVFGMLGRMMESSQGTFAIETIHSLMDNGDLIAASIHFAGRRGDTAMAMDGVDLMRVQDGKIIEMWLFSGDQTAEDAFWGQ
ncbi:nuclear transport factor 2 family protein [Kribbella antibiotica]|uniref:Nuclear transport factor 2 family protein n=1 Tax=Kribbella antibiotica TaxID=190195 RepID=A0A4R4YTZ9_9ACTN|nr:nuclear transport factor 2 family protein [Kribbella antibiotica]TDD48200.1 nuclear transport factor 2 family protein [Kribbella antibiotica]